NCRQRNVRGKARFAPVRRYGGCLQVAICNLQFAICNGLPSSHLTRVAITRSGVPHSLWVDGLALVRGNSAVGASGPRQRDLRRGIIPGVAKVVSQPAGVSLRETTPALDAHRLPQYVPAPRAPPADRLAQVEEGR